MPKKIKKHSQNTLIRSAKFSAKTVLMAKLLRKKSNLNDFEYSRYLKARKIEKRPKKILKAKPKVQNPKFQNFIIFSPGLDHLELI